MMGEVIDLSLDSQSSAGSTSALTLDISAVSYESGRRALQLAVDGDGSIEEIASLLEEEAEEHQKSSSLDPTDGSSSNETPVSCDHHTALEVAASVGHMGAVERLLEAGADPDAPVHEKGISVLEAAAAQGQLLVVQKLLETGVKVNHCGSLSGSNPLITAATGGHAETCKALLAAGADIHATAYGGQTMLEAAEDSGDADIQVQAALASRPPPQIDQPLDRGTGPLCETCRMTPLTDLFWGIDTGYFELHPSLKALRASASAGCPFCCFIWKRLGITSIPMSQLGPVVFAIEFGTDRIHCHVDERQNEEVDQVPGILVDFHFILSSSDSARVPITEDTSSPETYKQICTWLDTCKNEHPNCRPPLGNPSLPTRLIYLDKSRRSSLGNSVDTILQPRLMSTNCMEFSECKYIALSYRWPEDFPNEAKSTWDNIPEQMRGLNTSKLPQIFNDLFQVAVGIGISYVWIDSLCIIQDDLEDWNCEAARMIQIYQYAELTVAAAAPLTKPDLGLFRHGDPSDVLSVRIPGPPDSSGDESDQEVVLLKLQEETYRESPLVSRGWCFQEREISRRILHYTETQVLWECRTVAASEGLPKGIRQRVPIDWKDRLFDGGLSDQTVHDAWRRGVEDYSTRDLTVFTDKLPALSGLAAAIRDYKPANCRYLAGLWEDDFLMGLQWAPRIDRHPLKNVRTHTHTRYSKYIAPTWSWASVAGPISYLYAEKLKPPDPAKFTLKVLDIYIQTSTDDPFGAVRHAVLTCVAGLLPCVLGVDEYESALGGYEHEVRTADGDRVGLMDSDVLEEDLGGEEVPVYFCIHLGIEVSWKDLGLELSWKETNHGPALVVFPTGNRENEYRRVGMIHSADGNLFGNAEIKEITIV